MKPFSAVKVFNATMAVTARSWVNASPSGCAPTELQLVDRMVSQTSDDEYHCFTVTLFLAGDTKAYLAEVPAPFRSAVPRAGR